MKTAMIWGAGGTIAQALTHQLATQEWTVISVSRHPEKIAKHVKHAFEADAGNDYQVQKAVMSASYETEQVDLWIYAAGDIMASTAAEMDPDAWQRIIDANLTGAYLSLHRSLPLLAEDAHIVFIGAVSERLQLPRLSAYAAAKAGLEAFAEALRKEERRKNVMVVRPTAVDTPFWDKVPMRKPKDAASPEKVATKILEAVADGHSGQLDLG